MKMLLLLLSIAGLAATQSLPQATRPLASVTLCGAAALYCQPYAEKCLACKDCTQCGHCGKLGGKCSVCFKR